MKMTNRYLSLGEAKSQLAAYDQYIKDASAETKVHWVAQKAAIENWLASDEFKTGKYPQGLDDLVLDLIDLRSSVYAFEKADLRANPFSKHHFLAQWFTGSTYAILSILGKLISKDTRDNSLRNLWGAVRRFMLEDGACSAEEAAYIDDQLHHTGRFTNTGSKAVLLRNKLIAHNEASPLVEWGEIDSDIKILVRVWALIVGFCSLGIVFPFHAVERAFTGIESALSPAELHSLRDKRKEYLEKVRLWSRVDMATGKAEERSRGFAEVNVQIAQPID